MSSRPQEDIRNAKGLCIKCGVNPQGISKRTGKKMKRCTACAEKNRAQSRKLYEKNQGNKLCQTCGERPPAEGRKSCQVCLDKAGDRQKAQMEELKAKGICIDCRVEPIAPHSKNRCQTCLDKANISQTRKSWMRKAEVLRAYGGKCQECGETHFMKLSVDHVDNDGANHRKKIGNLYDWLKKNGFPKEGFQILCYNCNLGKQHNDGVPLSDGVRADVAEWLELEEGQTSLLS